MRQRLVALVLATTPIVGACSLLYNPNNLPPQAQEAGVIDADPDAEIILDTNPDAVVLDSAEPTLLTEGQGVGGSYSTILLIHGMQLVKSSTTVAITAHDGSGPITGITVDNARLDVSANGRDLAVPIAIAIDTLKGATTPRVRLDIAVTQMGSNGPVTATLTMTGPADAPALELEYLDELTTASPELTDNALAPGSYRYSKVDIASGGLRASAPTGPLRVASVSSIAIVGPVDVSATGVTPGAGGNVAGTGGANVALPPANPGGTGGGEGGGKSSGGGGGFGTPGLGGAAAGPTSGEVGLTDLSSNRSGGGGGGVGGVLSVAGGNGGGGGGVIELTAGGTLTLDTVVANGGTGTGTNASNGGGGSGGTILLRARDTATLTGLTATGGAPGGAGGTAGFMGGSGRIRVDAPNYVMPSSTPLPYRGPMLMIGTSLIARTEFPTFVVTGEKTKSFSYYFTNNLGDMTQSGSPQLVGSGGSQSFKLPMDKPLFRGLNHFCLLVDGATAASPVEGMNCFDLVYLYTP